MAIQFAGNKGRAGSLVSENNEPAWALTLFFSGVLRSRLSKQCWTTLLRDSRYRMVPTSALARGWLGDQLSARSAGYLRRYLLDLIGASGTLSLPAQGPQLYGTQVLLFCFQRMALTTT